MTQVDQPPKFPMPRECPYDPPPALTELRERQPVSWVRSAGDVGAWLITRHDHVREVLRDNRFSADSRRPGYPFATESMKATRTGPRSLLVMDGAEHAHFRRMLTSDFTVRQSEKMRPRVQAIVDRLIGDMLAAGPPVDLVQAFALPLPSLVICELLGVPYSDHDFFQKKSQVIVSTESTQPETAAAMGELLAFLEGLVDDKNREPGDDLLSRLAVDQLRPGNIDRTEIAGLAMLLLVAGHETTANMISLGTAALFEHPDQLARLRDDPSPEFVRGSVEELLRYLTVVHIGRRRVATEDVTIGDQLIRAGEGVIIAGNSGNRDPAAFTDPDTLDLGRSARHHTTFGFGVHQCLGQPLARLELQVVYGTLYQRIPALRLAIPAEEIRFKHDGIVYGVHDLPVTW